MFCLQFTPDIASSVPHHKHYALEVTENCSPTIDHCRIKSTSVGKFTFILQLFYDPTLVGGGEAFSFALLRPSKQF